MIKQISVQITLMLWIKQIKNICRKRNILVEFRGVRFKRSGYGSTRGDLFLLLCQKLVVGSGIFVIEYDNITYFMPTRYRVFDL